MSSLGRVIRNTGIIFAGNIATSAVGFITTIWFARYIGVTGFGVYSFVFAYLGFFGILIDLGITRIFIREMSRDKSKAGVLMGNAIILKIILSASAFLFCVCGMLLLPYPIETKMLLVLGAVTFLYAYQGTYAMIFQVELRMEYQMGMDVLTAFARLALFMLFINAHMALPWFVAAVVISGVPSFILTHVFARRFVRPVFTVDLALWKYIAKETWPLGLSSVFAMTYYRVDVLMLALMKGQEAVGLYSSVFKLTECFSLIPAAFMISIFPVLSRYFIESKPAFREAYVLSFKYMLMLGLPIAAGVSIFSAQIMGRMYGPQFAPAVAALTILIWAEVFMFVNTVLNTMFIVMGKMKAIIFNTVCLAFVNVTLNFFLISGYSFIACSTVTVITEAVGLVLGIVWIRTFGYAVPAAGIAARPLAACAVMSVVLISIRHLPLGLAAACGIITYAAAILLFKAVTPAEISFLWQRTFSKDRSPAMNAS